MWMLLIAAYLVPDTVDEAGTHSSRGKALTGCETAPKWSLPQQGPSQNASNSALLGCAALGSAGARDLHGLAQ